MGQQPSYPGVIECREGNESKVRKVYTIFFNEELTNAIYSMTKMILRSTCSV